MRRTATNMILEDNTQEGQDCRGTIVPVLGLRHIQRMWNQKSYGTWALAGIADKNKQSWREEER